ncbi:MAG TPA: DUF5666 domain-containing protein [Burkholderiaceae bacterium]|nr:DUF5666 domain-containing protein [Burkholderiaceae bacterium]
MTPALPRLCAAWVASALLAGCGGGTDGTGATPEPTAQVTSSGAMTRGSVILNGTRFDDSAAAVTDDRNRTAAQLADGMVVKLRGRSDDGATGRADRIDVENEVRGAIQSIDANANPQRFVVAGLTVLADDLTVYANAANFGALVPGVRVEVHGLRDAAGRLRATRIEANVPGADELRGPIGNVDTSAKTFTLNGNVTVNYAAAVFNPRGQAGAGDLTNGAIVEVRGTLAGGVFSAAEVDIEAREDAPFTGNAGEKQEVEGFVGALAGTAFQVGGRPVRIDAGTRFAGGAAADLANDVRVEVEGIVDGSGVLAATQIRFKRARLLLHGLATRVQLAPPLVVALGQSALVTDLTRIEARAASGGSSSSLADITPNADCVELRGFAAGPLFIADEIKEPSSCGDALVQARVGAVDTARFELTFFADLIARLDGAGVQFRDAGGATLNRDAFFRAATVGRLVKVRGDFAAGVLIGREAELQN